MFTLNIVFDIKVFPMFIEIFLIDKDSAILTSYHMESMPSWTILIGGTTILKLPSFNNGALYLF
jgi:hypothetical protein